MASDKVQSIINTLDTLSILEVAELSKALQEHWGVSAAAPVAMGMPMGAAAEDSGLRVGESLVRLHPGGQLLARASAAGAEGANSIRKRPARKSRRNCWRNSASTSGSSSTTSI